MHSLQKKSYRQYQQMKDLQKIKEGARAKQKQASRFSIEQELAQVQSHIKKMAQAQEQQAMKAVIGDDASNCRQKLKAVKRVLESNSQKENTTKQLIWQHLLNLHIKEYVFGNTEPKPSMLNILRLFDKVSKITIHHTTIIFNDIPLQNFQQARYCLELLQVFTRNVELAAEDVKKLELVKIMMVREFEECVKIVFGDGFKYKWLEHFVDVIRIVNIYVRIARKELDEALRLILIKQAKDVLGQYKLLTKQVLTQLYLLVIFLNPTEPPPTQEGPNIIHYLHAKNIVLNQNIIPDLITVLQHLKQTQYKCQLVPILAKAFHEHFHHYKDKANIFDQVVQLFEVGRSVYSYLEEMVGLIIKDPYANWNLEGNFLKKYFVTTVALKNHVPSTDIVKQWPSIIQDVISQAGSMLIPYAADCAHHLFHVLYEQSGKDYKKWSSIWMGEYEKALLSEDRGQVRGVVEFINPIILQINSQPSLLLELLELQHRENSKASKMGTIALLKCYKDLGKIKINNDRKSFVHADDNNIELGKKQIEELLLNIDSSISLKTLEFLTVHPKASQPMEPLELQITLEFYKHCLKTSIPEYRKNYLNSTKKMLQRLRVTYDHEVTLTPQQMAKKKYKQKAYFKEFTTFLSDLIDVCYLNIFPDVIYELASPSLELILMIGQFFSRDRIDIKKGQTFEAAHVLNSTKYYEQRNFDNLLCGLQSSYESVRLLSHQILQLFYDLKDPNKLTKLWQQSLINANKLPIKSYQYACRILAFVSQIYPKVLALPKKYSIEELNICQLFLNIIKERYQVFKTQFATQQETYYKNLIHGILTVFSYTLDRFASRIRNQPEQYQKAWEQIRQFLEEFFNLINQIVLFSVEVCSSSLSTVVLDTLPQSQTDKKYKVDCRGHFLEQTSGNEASKKVGKFIQSSALLTSMENEDEGVENTLVVSFYLLTREAGLVFQSIGNITATSNSQKYLPVEALIQLVNSYFYALINLKHMGSVDRIAGGLGKMAKLIFDSQDQRLSQLPQVLLEKLITNLKDGKFTNILRRSAGVPYAFTCLLKSQALKKKQMIEKTATALLELGQNSDASAVELRIHALNILKKIFQDGDLKGQMDPYTSTAFIASIRGFTSEDWGVRNSSLMLFTVLANRTVGIKPTYNLLQFFHKCPELLDFFSEQLQNMQLHTMYPPLYPIVLLMSRLLPFDLNEKRKVANLGERNLKQIRKDKLLLMLPLIEKAGLNSNHMGRVMAAKAVLPYMDIDGIVPYVLGILANVKQVKDNNIAHYKLITCYNLLLSLHDLKLRERYTHKIDADLIKKIVQTIQTLGSLVLRKQSAVVTETLLKIIHHFMEQYRQDLIQDEFYDLVVQSLRNVTQKMMKKYFLNFDLIIPMNMGNSMAVKECLHLHIDLLYKYQLSPSHVLVVQNYSEFLTMLTQRVEKNSQFLKVADTEIIEEYLEQIHNFLKDYPDSKELEKKLRELLEKLDLKQVNSDNILIKIIQLRTMLKIFVSQEVQKYLIESQDRTKNHFLQIAIFKYFQNIHFNPQYMTKLLYKFSKPEQLQELRECCVQHLSVCPEIKPEHYVVYVRLLEDEEYFIRYEMAKEIARGLKIAQINEEAIKNIILSRMTLKEFELWLQEATDYDIKRKNYQEERIFSYDKPNKYRSDVTNFIYCLQHSQHLKDNKQELRNVIERTFKFHGLSWEQQSKCIQEYHQDIINRNEYQFETVLRVFLMAREENKQEMKEIFSQHPLLESIYDIYTQ